MRREDALVVQKIGGHFGHDNFHDAFAVAGAGNAAGFGIGIAAAADERRIADAAGKFAAGAAGGSAGEETAVVIESDGANGAGFVAEMVFGGVGIFEAAAPGKAFTIVDEIFGLTKRNAVRGGKFFRACGDEHHVIGMFEDAAGEANGIVNVFDGGDGAGFEGGAVHEDGVELDMAVAIEVRAEAGVKCGVVFEDDDGGFDRVDGGAAGGEDFPTCFEGAANAGAAIGEGFVGDIPCAAVDD